MEGVCNNTTEKGHAWQAEQAGRGEGGMHEASKQSHVFPSTIPSSASSGHTKLKRSSKSICNLLKNKYFILENKDISTNTIPWAPLQQNYIIVLWIMVSTDVDNKTLHGISR